jgi:hypothetical protein
MKKLLAIAVLLLAATADSLAQGTLVFNNRISSTLNSPVKAADGTTLLSGADYWAQLYAGPDASSLQPIGTPSPFRTGAASGFWQSAALSVPTVAPGALAVLQVRAWFSGNADGTVDYATFDAAKNAGQAYGQSDNFNVSLGGGNPPLPDANILGNAENPATPLPDNFVGFNLVPEPSVVVLGVLGAAALLLRRRR